MGEPKEAGPECFRLGKEKKFDDDDDEDEDEDDRNGADGMTTTPTMRAARGTVWTTTAADLRDGRRGRSNWERPESEWPAP